MDIVGVERLGEMLSSRSQSLAVAESASGGLLSYHLTAAPVAKEFFSYGVVAYSYESKLRELCVSREALDGHGAVSNEVAREMAAGVRDRSGSTWGLACTGIAGPDGGTDEKPVGTVYVAAAFGGEWGSRESYIDSERLEFDGERQELRKLFAEAAVKKLISEAKSLSTP